MGNNQASPPRTRRTSLENGNNVVYSQLEAESQIHVTTDDNRMDLAEKIANLNIDNVPKEKHINILLLGETGVGKSTFINSVFNYLNHGGDFLKADKADKLFFLIPTMFTAYDINKTKRDVVVGSTTDENERLQVGESATQGVQTYSFTLQDTNTIIRLIDTPGMGDTDGGMEKDNANCENILAYISRLKELHAICFLFRPKTTRLNVFFKYCMDQILSRLEKSASNNLVFVFTNARGDDYLPGDTYTILQRVVKEIEERPPYVKIPLNNNVFCFDNEAFRYLAATKNGIKFFNSYRICCKTSWEKSSKECYQMITYIEKLSPHLVQNTSAINEARRMIYQLSQPMTEIAQLINDNLYVLERHKAHLSMDNQSLDEMKKKLYIPVINLKVTKLPQPTTVCTDAKCAELYTVGDVNKWHYKQRCHDPCHLRNVPKEIVGSPELINCAAMDSSTQICTQCSHRYSVHMHIYYITETVQENQIDKTISKSINTKERVVENVKKTIRNIETRKQEYDAELNVIMRCNAQFAHFLQHNAITPFSDSYAEYIQHLIIREKSLGDQANAQTLRHFNKLLSQHNMLKKLFDDALEESKKSGSVNKAVTPEGIRESIEELYKLKHNGRKVKELYDTQTHSRQEEHNHVEYIHPASFTKSSFQEKQKEVVDNKAKSANTQNQRPTQNAQNQNQGAQNQNHRGRRNYNHQNNNTRSRSNGPPRRRSPPPPYYNSNDINQPQRPQRNYTPNVNPRDDNRPPPEQPRNNGYYQHPPPPTDRRYSSSSVPERPVDNQPRTEPTSIQVNLTLPSRDGASTQPHTEQHQRDAQYPPYTDPDYRRPPYYRTDEPRYPPRDYYYPRDRDPYYSPREEEPYYPHRDPYYPPRDPYYQPRDPYYPPRDNYPRPGEPPYYSDPHFPRDDHPRHDNRPPYEYERAYDRGANQPQRGNDRFRHQRDGGGHQTYNNRGRNQRMN